MRSKKYKKILIIAGVILFLFVASAYFVGLQTKSHSVKLQESSENPAVKSSQDDLLKNEQSEISGQNNQNQKNNESQISGEVEKLIDVSLKVQDKTYTVKIKEGSFAYDLMEQLKNQGFSFSATEYSSLGFFVTEINGIKEDRKNSTYWTLYLNNKEATTGVSKLILKNGDLIEWKYENRNN